MFRTVSKLSQAAAHPRRGTNYTRNGISCKEWSTCYTTKPENAKEKNTALQRFTCKELCKDIKTTISLHVQRAGADEIVFLPLHSAHGPVLNTPKNKK
jgi:hypothetical protein